MRRKNEKSLSTDFDDNLVYLEAGPADELHPVAPAEGLDGVFGARGGGGDAGGVSGGRRVHQAPHSIETGRRRGAAPARIYRRGGGYGGGEQEHGLSGSRRTETVSLSLSPKLELFQRIYPAERH